MIKNYIVTTFRTIWRNKLTSFISIFGLSIGIACIILAGIYTQYEFSFDRFHPNFENTYRLITTSEDKLYRSPIFPSPYLEEIKNRLPGIEKAVRVNQSSDRIFSHNGESFVVSDMMFTDPLFFRMFSFNISYGNRADLNEPMKLFISESFAAKHFKGTDPIDENLLLDNENNFVIAGIFKDLPSNTIFRADIIASFESRRQMRPYEFENWYSKGTNLYFQLNEKVVTSTFLEDVQVAHNAIKPDYEADGLFDLEPIKDIHLYSYNNQWDSSITKSDVKIVIGIASFAIFILIISVINYSIINATRFREKVEQLKIKKTIGASTSQLIGSVSTEAIIMILISILFAYYMIGLLYPILAGFKEIGVPLSELFAIRTLLSICVISVILFGLVIFYPGVEIIRLSLTKAYPMKRTRWKNLMVNASISLQFAFTIIIMVSSMVIYKQIKFVTSQKLGFDKEQLLCISNPWDDQIEKRYSRFMERANELSGVKAITATRNSPMERINNGGAFHMMSDKDFWINAGRIRIQNNFFRVIGAEIIDGEDFKLNQEINKNSIIINRAAKSMIKDENVIGKELAYPGIREEPFVVVGVVADIQHENTLQETRPTVYFQAEENLWGLPDIIVRLGADNHSESIEQLAGIWKDIAPEWPFRYQFMDDRIDQVYKNEKKALSFLSYLAIISVAISCIGILGLSWLNIRQRTKEVGIRKVNGAGVRDMLLLLNRDYIKWIALGIVFSVPFSWYAMDQWLQNFAYKISMSWWIFALSGGIALLVALLTVSSHTLRAARRNPVEALRYE